MADRPFRALTGKGVLLADGVEHGDGTVDVTLRYPVEVQREGVASMGEVVASLETMSSTGVTIHWGDG